MENGPQCNPQWGKDGNYKQSNPGSTRYSAALFTVCPSPVSYNMGQDPWPNRSRQPMELPLR